MLWIFHGDKSVSQYSVIYQLGYTPFIMCFGIIMTFLMPLIYRQKTSHLTEKCVIFVLSITLVGFAIYQIFSFKILSFVVSSDFLQYSAMLPYMILAAGLYSAGDVLQSQLMYEKRVGDILKVKILTSLMCLIMNAVGAYWFGARGTVTAMIIFGLATLIGYLIMTRLRIKSEVVLT
jgi:O-antigen/teichoic acid export membrane protein